MTAKQVVVVILALIAGALALVLLFGGEVLGLHGPELIALAVLLLAVGLIVAVT